TGAASARAAALRYWGMDRAFHRPPSGQAGRSADSVPSTTSKSSKSASPTIPDRRRADVSIRQREILGLPARIERRLERGRHRGRVLARDTDILLRGRLFRRRLALGGQALGILLRTLAAIITGLLSRV